MEDDWADWHVRRWRNWPEATYDDDVEAATIRVSMLHGSFRESKRVGIEKAGLDRALFDTLFALMLRDDPGRATASELARDLQVSPAGMTGRVDRCEALGYLRREPDPDDRRRIYLVITAEGKRRWRRAIDAVGDSEKIAFGALSRTELHELNRLLKKAVAATPHAHQRPIKDHR